MLELLCDHYWYLVLSGEVNKLMVKESEAPLWLDMTHDWQQQFINILLYGMKC